VSYIERKRRGVRSIRAQMKKAIKDLKKAIAEGSDFEVKELEESLMKMARSKHELSKRVRFKL